MFVFYNVDTAGLRAEVPLGLTHCYDLIPRTGEMTQLVKYLPGNHEALRFIPRTHIKKAG